MSIRCKIDDVYGLHGGYTLLLKPGYTALAGPNGAGKTTLLDQLADIARDRGYLLCRYSDVDDGRHGAIQMDLVRGDVARVAQATCSSEGQRIQLNFSRVAGKVGAAVQQAMAKRAPVFVLLDGLDSGTSIDRQIEFMDFFRLVERDVGITDSRDDPPIYILAAVNDYEMATRRCVDVRTGQYVKFRNYDAYKKFVCGYFDAAASGAGDGPA